MVSLPLQGRAARLSVMDWQAIFYFLIKQKTSFKLELRSVSLAGLLQLCGAIHLYPDEPLTGVGHIYVDIYEFYLL